MSNFCPICQKEFKDILKHFSLSHEIGDINQLKTEFETAETKEKRKEEYGKFIMEINEKLHNKEITIEVWRNLRDKWEREHIIEQKLAEV